MLASMAATKCGRLCERERPTMSNKQPAMRKCDHGVPKFMCDICRPLETEVGAGGWRCGLLPHPQALEAKRGPGAVAALVELDRAVRGALDDVCDCGAGILVRRLLDRLHDDRDGLRRAGHLVACHPGVSRWPMKTCTYCGKEILLLPDEIPDKFREWLDQLPWVCRECVERELAEVEKTLEEDE
jgi:hypothetical protein